jgi:hypothetical protein
LSSPRARSRESIPSPENDIAGKAGDDLLQVWNGLAVALVDELHAMAATGLDGIADAAKRGLEQVQAPVEAGTDAVSGRRWSPWLIGAIAGIALVLLPRRR